MSTYLKMTSRRRSKISQDFVEPYINELGFEIRDGREQRRWKNISQRKVLITQFVSMDALRRLGLYDDVRRLFR